MALNFLSPIRSLNDNLKQTNDIFSKLASGKRITKAADDAAGLAIAAQLNSEAATLTVASRNAADSTSALNIAESALGQVGDIATRLGELSTQASNGTLSDSQRSALQTEFNQLTQEAQRIAATTEFNGTQLLNGGSFTSQVGSDSGASSQISVQNANVAQSISTLASQNIGTQAGAQAALDQVNTFISSIASSRGELGAANARLDTASEQVLNRRDNLKAAASRIEDADIADEAAKLTSSKIRANASQAVLAQAGKLNRDTVLSLLK